MGRFKKHNSLLRYCLVSIAIIALSYLFHIILLTLRDEYTEMKIEVVLERNREKLMSIPGVVGVGIGGSEQSPVIVVMVKELTPRLKKKLPRQLEGFSVQTEVCGEITAF